MLLIFKKVYFLVGLTLFVISAHSQIVTSTRDGEWTALPTGLAGIVLSPVNASRGSCSGSEYESINKLFGKVEAILAGERIMVSPLLRLGKSTFHTTVSGIRTLARSWGKYRSSASHEMITSGFGVIRFNVTLAPIYTNETAPKVQLELPAVENPVLMRL